MLNLFYYARPSIGTEKIADLSILSPLILCQGFLPWRPIIPTLAISRARHERRLHVVVRPLCDGGHERGVSVGKIEARMSRSVYSRVTVAAVS